MKTNDPTYKLAKVLGCSVAHVADCLKRAKVEISGDEPIEPEPQPEKKFSQIQLDAAAK